MQCNVNRSYADRDKYVSDLDKIREDLERSQVRNKIRILDVQIFFVPHHYCEKEIRFRFSSPSNSSHVPLFLSFSPNSSFIPPSINQSKMNQSINQAAAGKYQLQAEKTQQALDKAQSDFDRLQEKCERAQNDTRRVRKSKEKTTTGCPESSTHFWSHPV